MCVARGAFVYASEALKRVAYVPVSANVRITDPLLAEPDAWEDVVYESPEEVPVAYVDTPNRLREYLDL